MLSHRSEEEGGSPIQVGFITYDKVIHFYNVKVCGSGTKAHLTSHTIHSQQ